MLPGWLGMLIAIRVPGYRLSIGGSGHAEPGVRFCNGSQIPCTLAPVETSVLDPVGKELSMGASTVVRSAVWLMMLAGINVSQAQETVSAAVGSTVSAASASDGLQPKVQPLSEAELPKGATGEAIKAQESARNRQLRAKCKNIPVGSYEKYLCERPEQVELIESLDGLLKQVAALTPAWSGVDVAAEQQSWQTALESCRQQNDIKMCLEFAYLKRIAQLQAQFALVASEGPIHYRCEGIEQPLALTFYATNPPLLAFKQESQYTLAWMMPTSGGVNYEGEGVNFLERKGGGELTLGNSRHPCVQQP